YLFFFFFQAEDGIRDATVTGVQTCALPILSLNHPCRSHVSICQPGKRRDARLADSIGDEDFAALGVVRDGVGVAESARVLAGREIGRASCRERGEMWVGEGGVVRK